MLSVSALFTLHLLHFCVCVCSLLALFVGLLFVDVWDGVLSETMRSLSLFVFCLLDFLLMAQFSLFGRAKISVSNSE